MARPEDNHLLWDWEVVVTVTRSTRQGSYTVEGGWRASPTADTCNPAAPGVAGPCRSLFAG
jgi:hypothetical protein